MSNRQLVIKGQETLKAVTNDLQESKIDLTNEQIKCGRALLSTITSTLDGAGVIPNEIDGNSYRQALQQAMLLKLNASASPRECYIILRNVPIEKMGNKVTKWGKKIEFGVEGSGNDTLLKNFGIDVKEVGNIWKVREGDKFEYPTYTGFEAKPPKWQPKGKGKLARVVYPIKKQSGVVEYHIAEREDVVYNLIAHINQNMMPNIRNKSLTENAKKSLLEKVKDIGLEKTLDGEVPEVMEYISEAWKGIHSRESMIERKMRNNAIKKYPKDFRDGIVEKAFQEATDDDLRENISEKETKANSDEDFIDVEDFDSTTENDNTDNNESKNEYNNENIVEEKETKAEPKQEKVIETESENNDDSGEQELEQELFKKEMELNDAYSVEIQTGKYANKTLREIKKIDKDWFSITYEKAVEANQSENKIVKAIKYILDNDF